MDISVNYPAWWWGSCILTGIVYALILYFKDKRLSEFNRFWIIFLGIFRAIAVALIMFLLFNPLVKSTEQEIEKPVLVIAVDNSASVKLNKDSLYYQNDFPKELLSLKEELAKSYQVDLYQFGNEIKEGWQEDFSDQTTAFGDVFELLGSRYYNRNVGAVIVASDGLNNTGMDPKYNARNLKLTSFYAIALGDTTPQKDFLIKTVLANKIVFLGNDFPVQVRLDAKLLNGSEGTVSILKGGKELSSKVVKVTSNDEFFTLDFIIPAENIGKQKYDVVIQPVEGEITTVNNYSQFYVNVLDARQKILLLAQSPHPDVVAIRQAIAKNEHYELDVQTIDQFSGNLEKYNLVILHQLPDRTTKSTRLIQNIKDKKIPIWLIIGQQTDYNSLNKGKFGVQLVGTRGVANLNGTIAKTFSLFTTSADFQTVLSKVPPLAAPFAQDYRVTNGVNLFMYQRVGSANTGLPLWYFYENQGQKYGVLIGEGIWRWRLAMYRESRSHELFNQLISKNIQYLASKDNKNNFRIEGKSIFKENEDVVLSAELYNKAFELINAPEVTLTLKDEKGNETEKVFARNGNGYLLNMGQIPPGEYTYVGRVVLDGKEYNSIGEFSVQKIEIEAIHTVADHSRLFEIADLLNGNVVYPNEMGQLPSMIEKDENVQNVSYSTNSFKELIHWKFLFFVIVLLLSVEWFIRKIQGAY